MSARVDRSKRNGRGLNKSEVGKRVPAGESVDEDPGVNLGEKYRKGPRVGGGVPNSLRASLFLSTGRGR